MTVMYLVEQEYNRYLKEVGGKIISGEDTSKEIKQARRSLNITQAELGTIVGLRRETITRIENGNIQSTTRFVKEFTKTIAAMKVIRDLHALDEVSRLKGEEMNVPSIAFLSSCLNIPMQSLKLIFEIGDRRYLKKREKILKTVKEV
ncbi:MAG: helix-turn-helix domain-containing protein [Candidatus Hydrothermarchaeales archaeon]